MVKQLAILGSTGSIGTQTLDVVRAYPDRYSVYALCANRSVDKLVEQALEFQPEVVCIADESLYETLKERLSSLNCKIWAGADAIAQMVTMPSIDIVVASMVGYAGLRPTIEAIKAGKTIALANKETLVVAGEIICELAQQYHAPILPVDSEHSAIFQSLVGEDQSEIEKILLTASGGPFRTFSLEQMQTVTAADGSQVVVRCAGREDPGTRSSAVHRAFGGAIYGRCYQSATRSTRHAFTDPVCALVPGKTGQ